MKRGDLVTVAVSGVTVLRLSSEIIAAPLIRISVDPTPENGLRSTSQIMIDKAIAVPREKVGQVFGRLEEDSLKAVDRALLTFFGLGAL
ncbi:MAG TPA: type II toxin-antitoxin system PemK/MazF family toxin [Roseiarcus sp.]|nr:type II toxin-antitoxin system PemK/MazF family toxin [Roseiarcus sp.]